MSMTEAPEKKDTVLVIEDEQDLADLYTEWLTDTYQVKTAYTSESALENLSDDIDVIVLDRRLPGLSGDEVLKRIHEQNLDAQIAIVSAITPDFAVIGMGINEYLVKPIEKQDLRDLVDRMLERAKLDDLEQDIRRLESTKETLEAEMSDAELAQSDEYHELQSELNELRESAESTTADLEDG